MSWITSCSLHPTYNSECGVCIAWTLFASADAEPDPTPAPTTPTETGDTQ